MTKTEYTRNEFLNGQFTDREIEAILSAVNNRLPKIKAAWLEELKKDAVKVYGEAVTSSKDIRSWTEHNFKTNTHSALLIGITELEKKVCRHSSPMINQRDGIPVGFYCGECHAKLKATWSEI